MENIRQVSSFIKKIESRNIVVRRSFDPKSKNGMIYVVIGLDVDDSSLKKSFVRNFTLLSGKFSLICREGWRKSPIKNVSFL